MAVKGIFDLRRQGQLDLVQDEVRVSIGIVLGADAKFHLHRDVFQRTFHQLGQGKLADELSIVVQQRIIDFIVNVEIDLKHLIDRHRSKSFQPVFPALCLVCCRPIFPFGL